MTTETDHEAMARGVLESLADGELVLAVRGTEYRLHLVTTVPAGEFSSAVGKKIKGSIHARALRMHPASGGGKFIEPVWGTPRIVAGTVRAIDEEKRRVLVDAGVPLWVEAPEGQDFSVIRQGALVNFHVESGTRFRPILGSA